MRPTRRWGLLRPGNSGANTAADQIAVAEDASARERVGPGARPGRLRPANGQVVELTGLVDLSSWPERSRLICRRERPTPARSCRHRPRRPPRFQMTDQHDPDIAVLERRQRQHAEDHIRNHEDTRLAKLPFRDFAMNQVWLELVLIAHDLIAGTQALLLSGELAKAEPKRLRHRLLHVAARLAFHGRRARLRLQRTWPWARELAAAFAKLEAFPAPAR